MIAKIYVTLKSGVLDPQGKTVHRSLQSLGFESIENVRVGKYIEVTFPSSLEPLEAEKQVHKMCRDLLANEVIEEYRFDLSDIPSGGVTS